MDIPALESKIQTYFNHRAKVFNLRAGAIRVSHILNWGGFVNASFTISDGQRSYHLKLGDDNLDDFRTWQNVHPILENHYHAPELIDWVAIPETGLEGLLFKHIAGHSPDLFASPTLLQQLLGVVARLHCDQTLAAKLSGDQPQIACRHTFLDTYIDRLDGDLDSIRAETPAFVSQETLSWMEHETRVLEHLAQTGAAFDEPAGGPIHGDLWANNLLVTQSGRWYLLDWDDLGIGDPALDYTTIFAPPLDAWREDAWRMYPLPHAEDAAFAERMTLYARAHLLNLVIDVLADYVEANVIGEQLDRVRAVKKAQHLQALDIYRKRNNR